MESTLTDLDSGENKTDFNKSYNKTISHLSPLLKSDNLILLVFSFVFNQQQVKMIALNISQKGQQFYQRIQSQLPNVIQKKQTVEFLNYDTQTQLILNPYKDLIVKHLNVPLNQLKNLNESEFEKFIDESKGFKKVTLGDQFKLYFQGKFSKIINKSLIEKIILKAQHLVIMDQIHTRQLNSNKLKEIQDNQIFSHLKAITSDYDIIFVGNFFKLIQKQDLKILIIKKRAIDNQNFESEGYSPHLDKIAEVIEYQTHLDKLVYFNTLTIQQFNYLFSQITKTNPNISSLTIDVEHQVRFISQFHYSTNEEIQSQVWKLNILLNNSLKLKKLKIHSNTFLFLRINFNLETLEVLECTSKSFTKQLQKDLNLVKQQDWEQKIAINDIFIRQQKDWVDQLFQDILRFNKLRKLKLHAVQIQSEALLNLIQNSKSINTLDIILIDLKSFSFVEGFLKNTSIQRFKIMIYNFSSVFHLFDYFNQEEGYSGNVNRNMSLQELYIGSQSNKITISQDYARSIFSLFGNLQSLKLEFVEIPDYSLEGLFGVDKIHGNNLHKSLKKLRIKLYQIFVPHDNRNPSIKEHDDVQENNTEETKVQKSFNFNDKPQSFHNVFELPTYLLQNYQNLRKLKLGNFKFQLWHIHEILDAAANHQQLQHLDLKSNEYIFAQTNYYGQKPKHYYEQCIEIIEKIGKLIYLRILKLNLNMSKLLEKNEYQDIMDRYIPWLKENLIQMKILYLQ